jgi:hypothetical protein
VAMVVSTIIVFVATFAVYEVPEIIAVLHCVYTKGDVVQLVRPKYVS